jgi:O-antigen/teichoic acid export membrane protein
MDKNSDKPVTTVSSADVDDELAEEHPPESPTRQSDVTRMNRRHVRGSMLLLIGRLLSLFFTTATQVVIVRALSKADYGVFAYAFTLTASGRILLSRGQGKLLSRFMSKYEEQRDYARMLGAMLLAFGTIIVTSTFLLCSLGLFAEPLLGSAFDDPRAVHVLLVLMFLAPLDATDQVFVSLFAVFSKPTAIFFRKYIVTPVLRLGVVLLIALTSQSVYFLALGYVLTSLLGIGIYFVLLVRVLRDRGISHHLRRGKIILPFKEVFSFSIPTLTSELVYMATNMGSVVILGAYWGARQVADFRAVLPAARLNQTVYQTFVTMFLPMTARLHAREDHDAVRETYWHSSHFLAISTFPIFAMTTVFAPVTTSTLFGARYASAATALLALSIGYYVSIALGFNAYVLQIYGKLRYLVVSNIGVAVVCLAMALTLTPRFGATGAAVANGATMAGQNLVNQFVLGRTLRRGPDRMKYIRPYFVIAAGMGALVLVRLSLDPGFLTAVAICVVMGVVVLRFTRRALDLTTMFPELAKIPLVSRLVR